VEREQEARLTLLARIPLMELTGHEMQMDVLAEAAVAVLVERPWRMCRHVVVVPPVLEMEMNAKEELPVVKKAEKLAAISVVSPRACLGRMEPALGTVAASFPAVLAYPPAGSVTYPAYPAYGAYQAFQVYQVYSAYPVELRL